MVSRFRRKLSAEGARPERKTWKKCGRWRKRDATKKCVVEKRRRRKRAYTKKSGADPGFLPGEGAKGMMTLYGMGMNDFWHTQTQICNFSRCLLPYYAWMVLNNHSRDASVPSFCPWDEGTRAFGAGPSVPGVGARHSAPPPGSAPGNGWTKINAGKKMAGQKKWMDEELQERKVDHAKKCRNGKK